MANVVIAHSHDVYCVTISATTPEYYCGHFDNDGWFNRLVGRSVGELFSARNAHANTRVFYSHIEGPDQIKSNRIERLSAKQITKVEKKKYSLCSISLDIYGKFHISSG